MRPLSIVLIVVGLFADAADAQSVYVVFHRTDTRVDSRAIRGFPGSTTVEFRESGYIISGIYTLAPAGIALPSFRSESVRYGAGAVVGFEGHIGYGEHFTIVPGVRMHGLAGSWLVRPSVGAGWSF